MPRIAMVDVLTTIYALVEEWYQTKGQVLLKFESLWLSQIDV